MPPPLIVLVLLAAGAPFCEGCSVPVSYHALTCWVGGAHHIEAPAGAEAPSSANATVEASADGHLRAFFPGQQRPWWDAPSGVDCAALKSLCGSPMRSELVSRL